MHYHKPVKRLFTHLEQWLLDDRAFFFHFQCPFNSVIRAESSQRFDLHQNLALLYRHYIKINRYVIYQYCSVSLLMLSKLR